MMVSAENVPHGLVGHALHLRHDALVILLELVIDQDDTFPSGVHRDVAPIAFDLIEVTFDFVESQWWRLRALVLGVSNPATHQKQDTSENPRNKCSVHARKLYQHLTANAAPSRLNWFPEGQRRGGSEEER
jgi:hypothetical protein